MSLREKPTHWLPLNSLQFIINKPGANYPGLLRTTHGLYMSRRRRRRRREEGPCGTCIRGRGSKAVTGREGRGGAIWAVPTGGGRRPVTCGNQPHPVRLRFIIFLIPRHITRFLGPLLIVLLKPLQLLLASGKTERAQEGRGREGRFFFLFFLKDQNQRHRRIRQRGRRNYVSEAD